MKTTAQILRKARARRKLTLREVAEKTKIPLSYLELIEAGDFSSLPGESYAVMYVRGYARFLGVSPKEAVSFFRRDLSVGQPTRRRKKRVNFTRRKKEEFLAWGEKIFFDPAKVKIVGVGLIVLLLAGYLIKQYLVFNLPPDISVDLSCWREENQAWVTVSGKTNPDVSIIVESIPVSVDSSGVFEEKVFLAPGQKKIEVVGQSPAGKIRKLSKTVECPLDN